MIGTIEMIGMAGMVVEEVTTMMDTLRCQEVCMVESTVAMEAAVDAGTLDLTLDLILRNMSMVCIAAWILIVAMVVVDTVVMAAHTEVVMEKTTTIWVVLLACMAEAMAWADTGEWVDMEWEEWEWAAWVWDPWATIQ